MGDKEEEGEFGVKSDINFEEPQKKKTTASPDTELSEKEKNHEILSKISISAIEKDEILEVPGNVQSYSQEQKLQGPTIFDSYLQSQKEKETENDEKHDTISSPSP